MFLKPLERQWMKIVRHSEQNFRKLLIRVSRQGIFQSKHYNMETAIQAFPLEVSAQTRGLPTVMFSIFSCGNWVERNATCGFDTRNFSLSNARRFLNSRMHKTVVTFTLIMDKTVKSIKDHLRQYRVGHLCCGLEIAFPVLECWFNSHKVASPPSSCIHRFYRGPDLYVPSDKSKFGFKLQIFICKRHNYGTDGPW